MLAPMLVQMERQIDREIAADQKKMGVIYNENENDLDDDSDSDMEEEPVLMYGPTPQIITNDLKSLDEMVSHFKLFRQFCFQFNYYRVIKYHDSTPKISKYTRKRIFLFYKYMFIKQVYVVSHISMMIEKCFP